MNKTAEKLTVTCACGKHKIDVKPPTKEDMRKMLEVVYTDSGVSKSKVKQIVASCLKRMFPTRRGGEVGTQLSAKQRRAGATPARVSRK